MKLEYHKRQFLESLRALEFAVERGAGEWQRSIGFHASAAGIDLLSLYLFEQRLITPGTQINHRWLRSTTTLAEKLPFDFPNKDLIIEKMAFIESRRDPFCYGRTQSLDEIMQVIQAFQELRRIFGSMGVAPEDEA